METIIKTIHSDPATLGNIQNQTNKINYSGMIPFKSLFLFLLITFGIAWGIIGMYIFITDPMIRIFGSLSGSHPLFYLAVWSPGIAAFYIIFNNSGFRGIKTFMKGILLWKASWGWYVFLFFGIPLIFFAGAYLNGKLFTQPMPYQTFGPAIIAIALAVIKGPIEEFGWRGLALPLLQRRVTPISAALILGVIWGLWHTPAFILSGTQQSQWDFAPFFIGCIAISIISTSLFNSSRGSLLLSAFFHFNLMNPLWPDAQPYDTWILIVIALVVVWFYRKSMFDTNGGITRVIHEI